MIAFNNGFYGLLEKVDSKSLKLMKDFYQKVSIRSKNQKCILFIVGSGRSGTSLMESIFERDFNAKVYPERCELTSNDVREGLRLNPFSSVKNIIDKNKVPFIILKPLVETQNTLRLLEYFNGSKALWMFRHYKDVTSSFVSKWSDEININNLRPIVENRSQEWRCENISENTRNIVFEYFSEDMPPHDAAALFWVVRNRYFLELDLDRNPNVIMCKYEDLATNPHKSIKKIYEFIGRNFPGRKITKKVHSQSIRKGQNIIISPEIESLCAELWEKLNKIYKSKNYYA